MCGPSCTHRDHRVQLGGSKGAGSALEGAPGSAFGLQGMLCVPSQEQSSAPGRAVPVPALPGCAAMPWHCRGKTKPPRNAGRELGMASND